jgi:hypothetical protein
LDVLAPSPSPYELQRETFAVALAVVKVRVFG